MLRSAILTCAVILLNVTLLGACGSRDDSVIPQGTPPQYERMASASGGDDITNSRRNAITRAIEAVSPAVVGINVSEIREQVLDPWLQFFYGERVYREKFQSAGSGFIISPDGYCITNDHVAGRATEIVITMTDGTKHNAKIIGTDPVTDITLLKVEGGENFPYLKLGNSDDVIVGEWSIAFGNPFGLFSSSAKPTVTVGVISATHMYLQQREGRVYRNMLQTDAAINTGNSGGPLVNSLGEVIGVNTVIYTPNQGSVGVGFAVPINRVKEIVDILRNDGKVNRDFDPGFKAQEVNEAIAHAYNLDKVEGVVVTRITGRNSAARKSGLEEADIILRANGEPVFSIAVLESMIRYSIKGDVIRLDIMRNGNSRTLDLKLD
ncbi:MAG TPA: trypsin-like peptidase domain-containing protein [Bacteroidota bacterium]|nr:trypsin-like peptidase domain-containing protein [Bacteroidota bacterium]